MGTIEHFAKWNKKTKQWENPSIEDYGHCFSIADYETIINNPSDGINYIIIATGSRLERNTNEFIKINDNIYRIDNVINHYKNQKGTITICNPPYGERMLDIKEAEKLYQVMGQVFEGSKDAPCYIISPHEDFEKFFGRKADKRRKLYNGMLKCQLFMYYK